MNVDKRSLVVAAVLVGAGIAGWCLLLGCSGDGCKEVDTVFTEAVARVAGKGKLSAIGETKLDRAAVPCLLGKLTDAGVVAEIRHPGGRDSEGMPLVGHTQKLRAGEVARRLLQIILDRPGSATADIREEVRAVLLERTSGAAVHPATTPYLLRTVGAIGLAEAREPLLEILDRFMKRDKDWKWSQGRALIGAALDSLAVLGDAGTVARIVGYVKDPGCDFLYQALGKCLASIGAKNLPAITAGIDALIRGDDVKLGVLGAESLLRTLGAIHTEESLGFLLAFLDRDLPQPWTWLRHEAVTALGMHKSERSAPRLAREFVDGDESTRVAAEHALVGIVHKHEAAGYVRQLAEIGDDDRSLLAAFALGILADREDLAFLRGLEGPERFELVRKWAVARAEKWLRKRERKALQRRRYDAWTRVQDRRSRPEEVADLLLGILAHESPDNHTRCQVMDHLGMARRKSKLRAKILAALRAELYGGELYTRLSAAGALGRMGDRSGLKLIESTLASQKKDIQGYKPKACVEFLKITGKVHPLLLEGVRKEKKPYLNVLFYLERRDRFAPLRQLVALLSKKAKNETNATRALSVLAKWEQEENPQPKRKAQPREEPRQPGQDPREKSLRP